MPKSNRASRKSDQASMSEPRVRSSRELTAAWFSFHAVCERRVCRRAKRCAGGAMPPCFDAFWPLIEEREKMKFRATIKARADGASVNDAIAAGEADAARYDALMASLQAQDQAGPACEPAAPAQPIIVKRVAPPFVTRVRQL